MIRLQGFRTVKFSRVENSKIALAVGAGRGLFGHFFSPLSLLRGWSGGAMVLGKLPVPGRPTNLDDSRARAYCACSRCRWKLFGHFYSQLPFLSSVSLSLGDGPI